MSLPGRKTLPRQLPLVVEGWSGLPVLIERGREDEDVCRREVEAELDDGTDTLMTASLGKLVSKFVGIEPLACAAMKWCALAQA